MAAEPADSMAAETSSRIFARNLPPNLTEADFRKHFSQRFDSDITDIKHFPQRRIGYVGFKTAADASAAVKYFNKTFIRMSRIHVELATAPSPNTRGSSSTASRATAPTQTHDDEQRPIKRQRLSNDDRGQPRPDAQTSSPPGVEVLDMARKADLAAGKLKQGADEAEELGQDAGVQQPHGVNNAHDEGEPNTENNMSDMDWMRSRTSRLLGLEQDGEEKEDTETKRDEEENMTRPKIVTTKDAQQVPTPPPEETAEGAEEEDHQTAEQKAIRESSRLFLRNLPYTAQEEDLKSHFEQIGRLKEVHVPLDSKSGTSKGFAFVQFEDPEHAVKAYQDFDGTTFQGRLLHILPAAGKRENTLDEFEIQKLPVKKQKLLERKAQSSSSTFNWNSLYMSADAVMSSISDRLGVSKSEIFDPTASDAGVKQAQAETHVIQETKAYFEESGIDLGAFARKERGDTALLVKNFPYGTSADELETLFKEVGEVSRLLMPPSGTIAIVEFAQRTQARAAFATFSYRKYKGSVLFLEKAPKDMFKAGKAGRGTVKVATSADEPVKLSTSDLLQPNVQNDSVETSTLYVRNLNFTTTNERLEETFRPLDGFLSARVKTKTDAKRPGQVLSMGFGFVEFRTKEQARAALKAIDGFSLDDHRLIVKASHKGLDAAETQRREDEAKRQKARRSKLIIKNLPFEATKKDVRALFKTYGQLRSVRVPNKFDGSRKGYAFAEFTTPKEAENAIDALRNTHLLGRRLVIDFAAEEAEDAEAEIDKMQQKVDRQASSIALQRLAASSERKKFVLGTAEEDMAT